MESLPDVAYRILARHPAPALPLRELHRQVALARPGPTPTAESLLARIRSRRRSFRILDPWRGPWRVLRSRSDEATRRALRDAGLGLEPWVMAADRTAEGQPDRPDPAVPLLRTTMHHLSLAIDRDSASALARWILLLREERAIRRRLDPAG